MKVRKIDRPNEIYQQCSFPKEKLREIGWKGYRERRSQGNGKDPKTCMREAQWGIDGKGLCSQHAGLIALEHLAGPKENQFERCRCSSGIAQPFCCGGIS